MKLSWRDIINTIFLAAGGVLVYAKIQDYSWWLVNSWRGLALALGVLGVAMCITAAGDLQNKSILNRVETYLGIASGLVIIAALIAGVGWLTYTLAGAIATLWLISTARHTRHSLMHQPVYHRPATVH